ncbi:MAG: sigma 54-interacting transcriptional regulator [Deltaproteobacteria bacterium]|nr:sigma 54-interacting transcriptional regulator [Deltaproteobacteria bacterium]
MVSGNDPTMEFILKFGPMLQKLIEGNVGITVTSLDRWLAYFDDGENRVDISPGSPLPDESVSATCMREGRLVTKKIKSLAVLGNSYQGRAIPITGDDGSIVGSLGYLKVIDQEEEVDNIIIGRNSGMRKVYWEAIKVASVDTNILLLGETGTGKDLFAKLIHQRSNRKDRPFIAVNCNAVPRALFESEMFGYEPGAFTGAKKSGKKGFFELANSGTIFLDEIGDLDLDLQVKLLRVLQSRKVLRVGGRREIEVDVRVIAATNQNLKEKVLQNAFRSDLYYRLSSFVLRMPPLRYRKEDLPLLIDRLLAKKVHQFGRQPMRISPDAYKMLLEYDYPGNIRELQNILQRVVIMAETEEISERDLKEALQIEEGACRQPDEEETGKVVRLREMERKMIIRALRTFERKTEAARALGISRDTLYRKLRENGISS